MAFVILDKVQERLNNLFEHFIVIQHTCYTIGGRRMRGAVEEWGFKHPCFYQPLSYPKDHLTNFKAQDHGSK
jgi:hypothetical protein